MMKISANYLADRLPKALQILKKQNKILFGKNLKEAHEIRKSQFENFIHGIIRDIEPQELNLPTFDKKRKKQTRSWYLINYMWKHLAFHMFKKHSMTGIS